MHFLGVMQAGWLRSCVQPLKPATWPGFTNRCGVPVALQLPSRQTAAAATLQYTWRRTLAMPAASRRLVPRRPAARWRKTPWAPSRCTLQRGAAMAGPSRRCWLWAQAPRRSIYVEPRPCTSLCGAGTLSSPTSSGRPPSFCWQPRPTAWLWMTRARRPCLRRLAAASPSCRRPFSRLRRPTLPVSKLCSV